MSVICLSLTSMTQKLLNVFCLFFQHSTHRVRDHGAYMLRQIFI